MPKLLNQNKRCQNGERTHDALPYCGRNLVIAVSPNIIEDEHSKLLIYVRITNKRYKIPSAYIFGVKTKSWTEESERLKGYASVRLLFT